MTKYNGRIISRKTYIRFMKKYKLKINNKVNGKYKPKTMRQMSQEIYEFENNNAVPLPSWYFTK
jgi:hypothetical protein